MTRIVTGPVVLLILDGWGIRDETEHNAIAQAQTPNYDYYISHYPFTTLAASGEAVGLPEGQIGNSEVGHMTIGSGRIISQDLVRITNDIASGNFANNPAFTQVFTQVNRYDSQLHIIGLLSPGGVHSHEHHFLETIKSAQKAGIKKIILHPFLDGRDTPRTAGMSSLKRLEQFIHNDHRIHIGSVMGRYFSMDRDTNWDRTDKAFQAIFNGVADHIYDERVLPSQVIEEKYHHNEFDEHMEPIIFKIKSQIFKVKDNDGIIFTNFRKDRTKQLSLKIMTQTKDRNLCFVTMTDYGKEIVSVIAYKPPSVDETIGSLVSRAGMKQVHITETEKFPHATYFFNCGRQEPFAGEEDIMIPSRKDIKTHDEAPEMKSKEITEAAIQKLPTTDFMLINFANADMVGHTANKEAIIKAIEVVDENVGKLVDATMKLNGAVIITADHGNAERMIDESGEPHTAHTTNKVPFLFIHPSFHPKLRNKGSLTDIAPTVLKLLSISKPSTMKGHSLLIK